MKLINLIIAVLFLVSLMPGEVFAEGKGKIVYINPVTIIDGYYKTKNIDKELEKESKKKTDERDKMVKKINKLKDEVELMSKKVSEKKSKELNDLIRELQDFDRDARLTLKRKGDDAKREILQDIDKVIAEYGKKHSYDAILDDRVLLYADESIDITEAVVKILNSKKK